LDQGDQHLDRLLGILIGSVMLYLLVSIDPKEPSQSFARWVISPSPKVITFASIVYWQTVVGFSICVTKSAPLTSLFHQWGKRRCRTPAENHGAYDDEEQSFRHVLASACTDDIFHRSRRGETSPCRPPRNWSRGPGSAVELRLHERPGPEGVRRTHVDLWQSCDGRTIRDCAIGAKQHLV
jgi:hypothetical protein